MNKLIAVQLFEDNSTNFNFEKGQYNWLNLSWKDGKGNVSRAGNFNRSLYKIADWKSNR